MLVKGRMMSPNVAAYNVMLDGLCKLGKFKLATDMWSRMVINGHRPDFFSYSILFNWLCNSGNIDGAS
jgi:pentatricopeptide repeat protein